MNTGAVVVQLFTASGLIPMILALDAIWRDQAYLALIWLGLAMLIDGLDGRLTRRFNVAVIFLLGTMTFVPVRFIEPLRIASLCRRNGPLVLIWAVMALIYLGFKIAGPHTDLQPLVDILFLTSSLYFLFFSGWRFWSLRTREDTQ